jgi:hypothetical protein
MAGAVSIYLKKNEGIVDTIMNNPLISGLGVVKNDGMVDIELLRDALKGEINKAGFMRLTLPIIGDIDFTPDDVDTLYKFVVEADSTTRPQIATPQAQTNMYNGGVY